ncbi:sugar nucleotide-binding protein [Nonomuraea sp. KC401]|uniref:NAD(P)-dependent oxidoreductase n=1 Tax=unclassified Nonomuraea TaxID=2593643 RepID=UPI0010FF3023|nr:MULTISPECIES: NAD(P)H-binding protein [unclassified Nonomuraea]NBE91813.1 NAD(P)H-binding protein [Nonomuraea sp. K271]TLF86411.1 sugar nucleotide-binding protein [Nonomuraea sp. KC401]
MKLVVFGASGGTGRELVGQARAAGHQVTAVVRTRGDLADTVVADIFDSPSLVPLLTGHDAVLSALGPRGRTATSVCSTAVAAISQAMTEAGVRRIVAISAQPVLRGGAGEPWWHRLTIRPLVRTIYRHVYRDLERMEHVLAAGDTDWTVLRPPYLTDDPPSGRYRTAMEANLPGWSLTRGDLARAMLDTLDDPATIRRALGVGPA